MKKFFSKPFLQLLIAPSLTFLFFAIPLIDGKVPIPADSMLGLYHPFRDVSWNGYGSGKFPVKNPLITDPVLQTYPWRSLVIEDLKKGNLPLWNSYNLSGQPLLANPQSSPFQLGNILFFIFPFKVAWSILIIAVPVIASLFMFLFLKELKLSSTAAVFGAFVLPFTGFFISWLTWGTVTVAAMWLPLVLLCINKFFSNSSYLWFLLLTFSTSQVVFSGHFQTSFYIFLIITLYLFFLWASFAKLAQAAICFLGIILGIAIAMIQIIPSQELISHSARAIDQGYLSTKTDWFLPIQHLIQLLVPDYFGNPSTYNYWGIWNYGEFVSFIGIIPFSLALFALNRKDSLVRFFIAIVALSLIIAIENPVSKIPYVLQFPYVSSMQPSRILFLLVFSLSVLCAFGVDYFLKTKPTKKIFFIPILTLGLLVLLLTFTIVKKDSFKILGSIDTFTVAMRNLALPILTGVIFLMISALKIFKIPPKILVSIIFLVTVLELYRFGLKFIPFSKLSWIFPQTETTKFLISQQKPFRIMTTDRRIMHPNISAIYGIESVDGYDPLYQESYAKLVSVWQTQNPNAQVGSFNRIITPQKIDSPFINLLNIEYILTFDNINDPSFVKVFGEGLTKVYRNQNVLPRAFFVNEVIKKENDEQELASLLEKNFNPTNSATSKEFSFSKKEIKSSITFRNYSTNLINLSAITNNDALLIVTNVFYPGWRAFIDGKETQIKKVDFMFQSIIVPEGYHEVTFKFAPRSFYNGLYLSIAGVIGSLIISIYLWKRKFQ